QMARMNFRTMKFAKVYPLYVQKVERKGRTKDELDDVINWLTGFDAAGLQDQLARETDFEAFFAEAPRLNPNRNQITGSTAATTSRTSRIRSSRRSANSTKSSTS